MINLVNEQKAKKTIEAMQNSVMDLIKSKKNGITDQATLDTIDSVYQTIYTIVDAVANQYDFYEECECDCDDDCDCGCKK